MEAAVEISVHDSLLLATLCCACTAPSIESSRNNTSRTKTHTRNPILGTRLGNNRSHGNNTPTKSYLCTRWPGLRCSFFAARRSAFFGGGEAGRRHVTPSPIPPPTVRAWPGALDHAQILNLFANYSYRRFGKVLSRTSNIPNLPCIGRTSHLGSYIGFIRTSAPTRSYILNYLSSGRVSRRSRVWSIVAR